MPGSCKAFANTFACQQGLGMLLGTGHISTAMHDQIISLINEKEAIKPQDNDSEKPPAGYPRLPRKDPPSSLANPTDTASPLWRAR